MDKGLSQGFITVEQAGVFADNRDIYLTFRDY